MSVVSNKIKERISSLKNSKQFQYIREVLKDPICSRSLAELKRNFVIVPIDKAFGNVGFVCKRFYAEVLVKELGLNQSSNITNTYEQIDKNPLDITKKDSKILEEKFKLNVPEES